MRRGRSWTSWVDPCLPSGGGGDRQKKPAPDLATVSFPKSTADASVSSSWLTLTQMYKEPHWRTWVLGFCYLKTGGNVLPCSSFVQGDWSPSLLVAVDITAFRRRVGSVPVCIGGSKSWISKSTCFSKCWLKCRWTQGATRQLRRTWACSVADQPEPDLVSHDRHLAG